MLSVAVRTKKISLSLKNFNRRRALNLTMLGFDELMEGALQFDDPNLLAFQAAEMDDFFELFHLGVLFYLNRDWQTARYYLELAIAENSQDGPADALLQFITLNNDAPPVWFTNYRPLIIKVFE